MHLVRKNGAAVEPARVEAKKSLVGIVWAELRRFRDGLGRNRKVERRRMRAVERLAVGSNEGLKLVSGAGACLLAETGTGGVPTIVRARLALVVAGGSL